MKRTCIVGVVANFEKDYKSFLYFRIGYGVILSKIELTLDVKLDGN